MAVLDAFPTCCGAQTLSHLSGITPAVLRGSEQRALMNGYSFLVAIATSQQTSAIQVLKAGGWKEVNRFRNPNSGNICQVFTKTIRRGTERTLERPVRTRTVIKKIYIDPRHPRSANGRFVAIGIARAA